MVEKLIEGLSDEAMNLPASDGGWAIRKLGSPLLSHGWRIGEHKGFDAVTLRKEISYFAVHESTHLSQTKAMVR